MADKNNEDTTINLDALSQGTADEVSEVNDVMGNSDGQTAQPERVTFEQWLEAQTNLTPEQRQALLDHNADAAVTFSPEAFDGYLAELRSADIADSAPANDRPSDENQTSGETPAPQDEQNPENADALFNLASVYQIQNNHSEACKYFEKSYAITNDEKSLVGLTLSEFKGGNYIKAIEHYKALVVAHPEKDSYLYNLAICYEQVRDFQNAINILKQLLTRNPKSVNMAQKLAGLYMEIKDLRSAKDLYDNIILKNSPTANVLYQYAIISSQLYDTDTAERIFKKVIGMNPDNALAHKDLGVIYLNKRLFDYAEDEFKTALKLAPESYDIIFEYANFLYSVTKYKEADEYYEKALQINDDVIAKTLRAMNKIELNELDKAKELIDSAIKQEPNHEYIQFMAGRIYFALKEYEEAKRYIIHSIEQNPDIESQNLLALTYFGLEEYQNAVNIFENLLKKNENNISLLLNAAQCYEKLGDNDKALEKLYKLTDIFPEHEEAQEMIRRLS